MSYESQELLHQYLLFHYGKPSEIFPHQGTPSEALDFPVRSVAQLADLPSLPPDARALDLGCAVGRSAFELSKHCQEVVGIDFSHAFIEAAETLRSTGQLAYNKHEEGHLHSSALALRPAPSQPDRIRFQYGDACDLPADLAPFDLVHAANLICRLPDPRAFLQRLPSLVKPAGQLLLTTPCTWLADYTPPDRWPPARTLDWLEESLDPHFERELLTDLPFVIRETARKFQYTVAQASRWRRR
jgi:putative 4-mercaptohistidine N1-methyltranferase